MGLVAAFCAFALIFGCQDQAKVSEKHARAHVSFIAQAAKKDVGEVRRGMPAGAKELGKLFAAAAPEKPAASDARRALVTVRAENNDLDSAKSTFFLVAAADGTILRNNLDQDEMAGKDLFSVYPGSKEGLSKDYLEFVGSWEVARGVNGRPDAQWIATARIADGMGQPVGLYVSGWSWSSYAYRLEVALRSEILGNTKEGGKVPLTYVYVIVGDQAYGAPVSPVVNGTAIVKQRPLEKLKGQEIWSTPIEIERRQFGLAVARVPELGPNVAIAVLRSET
jgi:hypothetical protein